MPRADATTLQMVLAFAVVYVVWGSTYLAIRYGIETLPPFYMSGVRFVLAGSLLYVIARVRGAPRPRPIDWRSAAIIGGLMLFIGNGSVTWAEQVVPSGVAALIIAATPLFMVLFQGRIPAVRTVAGLVVGFAGIAFLIGPGRLAASAGGPPVDPWGALALIVASASWAVGSLYSRTAPQPATGLQFSGMQMLAGGALLLVAGTIHGELADLHWAAVSARSIGAFFYLVVFGSLLGFTSYVWLLRHTSPARASTYAYVNPVVAVLLGWLMGGEPLHPRVLVATVVIVGAVAMIITAPAAAVRR